MRSSGARTRVILWVLIFVSCLASVIPALTASADQITTRALTLQTGTKTGLGGSTPGSVALSSVNHQFSMTFPDTVAANPGGTIGSILMQYCTTASGVCTLPPGLNTANAAGATNPGTTTMGTQTGMGSAFTLNTSTNGSPYLTRTASALTPGSAGTWVVQNITNPTAANASFYVRISTYVSNNTTGSPIDAGVVVASTANPIVLSGQMPESLTFCTGAIIPTLGAVAGAAPDCTGATSGTIAFSSLFSTTATATATSQMAASTNAGGGYAITYTGDTLKNGSYSIRAIGTVTGDGSFATSTTGSGQFGLNLAVNTTPAVGVAKYTPTVGVTGNTYNGAIVSAYNTANSFAYFVNTPTAVANSASNVTDLQTYTVSYIVNVPGSQPAGTYTTTITYICTPTF